MKYLACFTLSVGLAYSQLATYGLFKTVTTSGTAVRLSATSLVVRSFVVQAPGANTGVIYIGGSDILAASKNGVALTAATSIAFLPVGEHKTVNEFDLKNIWIDSTVSAEGVSVTYIK